jgi:hypothetical protein
MFKTPGGIAIIIGFSVLSLSVTLAVYVKFRPQPVLVVVSAPVTPPPQHQQQRTQRRTAAASAATSAIDPPIDAVMPRLPARRLKSSEIAPLDSTPSTPSGDVKRDDDAARVRNSTEKKTPPLQQESVPADDGNIFRAARDSVEHQTYQASAIAGGAFGNENFADVSPSGILIGLRIGIGKFLNYDIVQFIEPIYLTPDGAKYGEGHGKGIARIFDLKAPAGYAVGAITVKGGGGIDSIYLDYMRIRGSRLDPADTQTSERVGGPGGGFDVHFNGNGTPLVGIVGRMNKPGEYLGLGAIYMKQPKPVKTR